MKYNLSDFTFLITIRLDSLVRLENILITTEMLLKYFNTNIFILEADKYENKILRKLLNRKIRYSFLEDKDPVFHRTKYHNQMTLEAQTPYIGIWDSDIILTIKQIVDAAENIRGGFEIAYPYNGICYDTSDIVRELFVVKKKISFLSNNKNKMKIYHNQNLKGGAMFVNKEAYILAGMENESFYGWGDEDFERFERWNIIGYKIYRSEGCMYHLSHPKNSNSYFYSGDYLHRSKKELFYTRMCDKKELLSKKISN